MITRREFALSAALAASGCAGAPAAKPFTRPLAIAHRGASGERPESTLAAFRLAISYGVDFIEPDLVSTKDGVLIVRHENDISQTTDVAQRPEFAARKAAKIVDGQSITGWFSEDFTLAEIRTLRCKERLPQLRPQSAAYDGQEAIPTFQEVIDLAKSESKARGRTIGIYPETKHPTYFRKLGLPIEPGLLAALKGAGWTERDAPVFIQSFEAENLKAMRGDTNVRFVQLIGGPAMTTAAGLKEIATYAQGIGPDKDLIIPRAKDEHWLAPTRLVADAHAAGLVVHPYTFRIENYFLPLECRLGDPAAPDFLRMHGDFQRELLAFLDLGIDGFFSDNSKEAVLVRDYFSARGPLKRA